MTLFWIVAALLIAVALLFVLPPLLKRSTQAGAAAQPNNALNVAVYRDQQRELEADRRAGTLSDEQYERARVELERRLLDDVAADPAPATARPLSRVPAIVVGLALPLLAVGLYFAVGSPRALAPVAIDGMAHSTAKGRQRRTNRSHGGQACRTHAAKSRRSSRLGHAREVIRGDGPL